MINEQIKEYLNVNDTIVDIYLKILANKYKYTDSDYGAIDFLLKKCLISLYNNRNNDAIYFAVDPSFSFPALLLSEIWERDENIHCIDDLLKSNGYCDLKKRYYLCETIVNETMLLFENTIPFLSETVVRVNGYNQIATYVTSLINTTAREIRAVVSSIHLPGEIAWQALTQKMKDGLIYKRISTFEELNSHGYEIYKSEIENYNEELYIYPKDKLPQEFYIINNVMVLFFAPNRNSSENLLTAQVIQNGDFIKRYMDTFNVYLKSSLDLRILLPKLTKYRENKFHYAQSILSKSEYDWFVHIFDYGKFAQCSTMKRTEQDQAISNCLKYDLIEVKNNHYQAKYNLEEIINVE